MEFYETLDLMDSELEHRFHQAGMAMAAKREHVLPNSIQLHKGHVLRG